MSGLENITGSIVSKAELEAKEIMDKAQTEADEIIKSAKSEMEEKRKTAEDTINDAVCKIMLMGQGSDRQEERQVLLSSKRKTISEIIEKAKNKMKSMEKEEYRDTLLKLINMYSEGKEGKIIFSARAKELADEKIKSALKEEKLEISEELLSCDSGFVIRYGKVEINCSYDSLFEEKYSELTDLVNSCITD